MYTFFLGSSVSPKGDKMPFKILRKQHLHMFHTTVSEPVLGECRLNTRAKSVVHPQIGILVLGRRICGESTSILLFQPPLGEFLPEALFSVTTWFPCLFRADQTLNFCGPFFCFSHTP